MVVALAVVAVGAVIGVRMMRDARSIDEAKVGVTDIDVALSGFGPEAVRVPAGTTVTWHFDDSIEHDVVSDGGNDPFRSERLTNGTFAHTFTDPGTYDYVCTLHPGVMRGRVVVNP